MPGRARNGFARSNSSRRIAKASGRCAVTPTRRSPGSTTATVLNRFLFGLESVHQIHDRAVERAEAVRHAGGYDNHVLWSDTTALSATMRPGLARTCVETCEIGWRRVLERAAGDERPGAFDNLINLRHAIVDQ